jgi:putative transposase
MASPTPLVYDTYYHIFSRGVNRENIFHHERNYDHFLKLYAHYIEPVAETYAYCLLKNHFHVLLKVKPEKEILECKDLKVSERVRDSGAIASKQFSDFFNAYAKAMNKAYNRTGSLFQHPYGRLPVTQTAHFYHVVRYIHQNPQKHKFTDDFRDWKYSSYGTILSELPTHLKRNKVLDWFGGAEPYRELHGEWTKEAWLALDDD